jgi:cell wall-associated NlpC family hydrolase
LVYRSRRRQRVNAKFVASAVVAGLLLAASHSHTLTGAAASTAPSPAAATAVAYARAQLGKPYVYGATGPDAFDCSGLVMAAWQAAGVSIPRTSEQQWDDLPHVSSPQPGDLIFYTGSPIDPPPGHVTMYLGGGQMIEAYGTGVPVRVTSVRSGVWGYADPGGTS